MDRSGKFKDVYYVFKSYWLKDFFVYLEFFIWMERSGFEGRIWNMSVFSNCESVELFYKGKSLGRKNRNLKEFFVVGLNWDIFFDVGENLLVVEGYM